MESSGPLRSRPEMPGLGVTVRNDHFDFWQATVYQDSQDRQSIIQLLNDIRSDLNKRLDELDKGVADNKKSIEDLQAESDSYLKSGLVTLEISAVEIDAVPSEISGELLLSNALLQRSQGGLGSSVRASPHVVQVDEVSQGACDPANAAGLSSEASRGVKVKHTASVNKRRQKKGFVGTLSDAFGMPLARSFQN